MVPWAALLLLAMAAGQEVTIHIIIIIIIISISLKITLISPCDNPVNEVTVEEAAESMDSYEYADYDYSDYYYYQQVFFKYKTNCQNFLLQNEEDFENVYHPSHSYLYDVPGYPDLTCASNLQIKVLSAKFGYSKPSFAETSHPCVFDFTSEYRAGQCSTSRLSHLRMGCPAKQSFVGNFVFLKFHKESIYRTKFWKCQDFGCSLYLVPNVQGF